MKVADLACDSLEPGAPVPPAILSPVPRSDSNESELTLAHPGLLPRRGAGDKIAGGTGALVSMVLLLLAGCAKPPALPVFGQIPQFDLVAQTGQPFDSRSLDGHIWVANFVFTTCPNICPMMSSRMRGIQQSTAATPEVKLVSFTVDPANDTPRVLAEYAKHFRADPARWTFLTGDIARLNDLGLNAFKLNPVDGKREHSPRFVLLDGRRRIRGYYLSNDDEFPKNLLRDLRLLQKESS